MRIITAIKKIKTSRLIITTLLFLGLSTIPVFAAQINLLWGPSTDNVGVAGYNILRSTTSGSSYIKIGISTTTSYSDSQISPGMTYYYVIQAYDAAGNVSLYSNETTSAAPSPESIFPIISNVSSTNINQAGAMISWTTNKLTDSQVEYGPTNTYGNSTSLDTQLVTLHSKTITGLTANTLYHYRVKSKDTAGNLAISGDFTFTTLASATVCGNGVVELGEQCDGGNLSGKTCATLGFTGGALSCNSNCSFNTTACTSTVSTKFAINDTVVVTQNVKVRATPSLSGKTVGTARKGLIGKVIDGPSFVNGYWWWKINYNNGKIIGWSVENYLAKQ